MQDGRAPSANILAKRLGTSYLAANDVVLSVEWSLSLSLSLFFFFFSFFFLFAPLGRINYQVPRTPAQNSNYNTVSLRHSALAFAMFLYWDRGSKKGGRGEIPSAWLFWLWIVLDGDRRAKKGGPRGASHIPGGVRLFAVKH